MRYLPIVVLFFCISCSDTATNSGTASKDDTIRTDKNIIYTNDTEQEQHVITDWDKLEIEVANSIEMLEQSDSNNRYERIEKFISYADKVDGGISEVYSNFAFEYADDNFMDFFNALNKKDSLIVNEWAKCASLEIMLVSENQEEEFLKIFDSRYKSEITKLPYQKQQLAQYYLDRLNEYAKGDWLPK